MNQREKKTYVSNTACRLWINALNCSDSAHLLEFLVEFLPLTLQRPTQLLQLFVLTLQGVDGVLVDHPLWEGEGEGEGEWGGIRGPGNHC